MNTTSPGASAQGDNLLDLLCTTQAVRESLEALWAIDKRALTPLLRSYRQQVDRGHALADLQVSFANELQQRLEATLLHAFTSGESSSPSNAFLIIDSGPSGSPDLKRMRSSQESHDTLVNDTDSEDESLLSEASSAKKLQTVGEVKAINVDKTILNGLLASEPASIEPSTPSTPPTTPSQAISSLSLHTPHQSENTHAYTPLTARQFDTPRPTPYTRPPKAKAWSKDLLLSTPAKIPTILKSVKALCIADQPSLLGRLLPLGWLRQYEIARHMKPSGLLLWQDIEWDVFRQCQEAHPSQVSSLLGASNHQWYRMSAMRKSSWDDIDKADNISRCVVYTGFLQFDTSADPFAGEGHWSIKLGPPSSSASNRFYRKFDSERFLSLKLDVEGLSQSDRTRAMEQLQQVLAQPILFLGRLYEYLCEKDGRLICFATTVPGLQKTSLADLVSWHMPIDDASLNLSLTMSKFWSRLALGFSDTIQTVVFKPGQIKFDVPDGLPTINPASGRIMTDGCSMASVSCFTELSEILSTKRTACAVQARLGGAKGVWIIDPSGTGQEPFATVRNSQQKFSLASGKYDPQHWTLEVCKVVGGARNTNTKGTLNWQIIGVLQDGGVPAMAFVEIVNEFVKEEASHLMDWTNPARIWSSIATLGRVTAMRLNLLDDDDEEEPIMEMAGQQYSSGMPRDPYETCLKLLEAGFLPTNCPLLAHKVRFCLEQLLAPAQQKYRIPLESSAHLMAIPDPTGLLAPGEVFVRLSSGWRDRQTGIEMDVLSGQVLVARNPCVLPTDVQKVRARDIPELYVYTDLIVFSVQGSISTMELLSGGDFDGDMVYAYWDPRLVDAFHTADVRYASAPFSEDVCFDKDTRRVGNYLSLFDDVSMALQQYSIDDCLHSSMNFHLGIYHGFHVANMYYHGYRHEDSVYLAHMCSKLVDAPKQGLKLRSEVFQADRRRFSRLPIPRWYSDLRKARASKTKGSLLDALNVDEAKIGYAIAPKRHGQEMFVLDVIRDELQARKDAQLKAYKDKLDRLCEQRLDQDIASYWNTAERYARESSDNAYLSDLELVERYVKETFERQRECRKEARDIKSVKRSTFATPSRKDAREVTTSSAFFDSLCEPLVLQFRAWPGKDTFKSEIMRHALALNNQHLLLLKASCAYTLTYYRINEASYTDPAMGYSNDFCWRFCFDELCRLKADAVASKAGNRARTVIDGVYMGLKMDSRWAGR